MQTTTLRGLLRDAIHSEKVTIASLRHRDFTQELPKGDAWESARRVRLRSLLLGCFRQSVANCLSPAAVAKYWPRVG